MSKRFRDGRKTSPNAGSSSDAPKLARPPLPDTVTIISSFPYHPDDMWTRADLQVNPVLAEIYRTGFFSFRGSQEKLIDSSNPLQGRHLYNLVRENKFRKTLEIGLAMGTSAIWISQAHKDNDLGGQHLAIDPNQSTQYRNIGLELIDRCGLSSFFGPVIEKTSYRALPELLEQTIADPNTARFDLIFIDGFHTFDYTLLDFFFSDLLLNINGVLVLDDIRHPSVAACFRFICANYKHYELVQETPCFSIRAIHSSSSTQATFIKRREDDRPWKHFCNF